MYYISGLTYSDISAMDVNEIEYYMSLLVKQKKKEDTQHERLP